MSNYTILFNKACQTCHKALAVLEKNKIKPTIREYLKDPLSAKELKDLLGKLKMKPEDLARKKDKVYKSLKLDQKKLTEAQWLKTMAENPSLIERPVVIAGKKAVIARPPEKAKEVL